MKLPLTGYADVELLRATAHSKVFGATRQTDGREVVAKVFGLGDESEGLEARVEHEFALLSALDIEGVVRPLGLERSGDHLVLLLERVAGVDLATHVRGQVLDLERFVRLALQIAELLDQVHAAGVVHRDIKPTNILVEAETGRVHLADFGISVLLQRARQDLHDRAMIEGTLPYISPEQTGRTKRRVDCRSDLYSLGVTFYELLAGAPPFAYDEPLELVHAHLARQPPSLSQTRPELPPVFDRLVAKLMAKDPEARYQTARSLAHDLREVLGRVESGLSLAGFELGAEDRSSLAGFAPIHELRPREHAELCQRIAEAPRCESGQLCLIHGDEGMGKSTLLDTLGPQLTLVASHVGRGSFGERRELGGHPYAALVEALGEVAGQLLTLSESELERWRARLVRALGDIRSVITELVPAFAAILGPPTALSRLDPHASRNRTQLAFTRLFAALTEPARPLVLILERLDCADKSSVALLRTVLGTPACAPLLILASSAPIDELGEAPMTRLLGRLGPEQLSSVELGPLPDEVVERLLVARFDRPARELAPLRELLARKTNNNPRFIRQLLAHLIETEHLRPSSTGWTWDPQLGAEFELPDDFRALLARKFTDLTDDQTELVCAAACIGSEFELTLLAKLVDLSPTELLARLTPLLDAGLIDRNRGCFRFAHATLREAALAALEAARAEALHWRLAQQLLDDDELAGPSARFTLAEHLVAAALPARGLPLARRVQLAEHLRDAGREALASAAYEPARRYLELGRELITDATEVVQTRGSEAPEYPLVVELHHLRAQLLGVAGQLEAAGEACQTLLAWPLELAERGRVGASWIAQLHLEGRSRDAVDQGLALLAELGCSVPRSPSWLRARLVLLRAWLTTRGLELDDLRALRPCDDARARAVMAILDTTKNASYVVDPRLYVSLIAVHVRWVRSHGMHPSAPLALAQLAVSVGAGLGRVPDATAIAERAVELLPDPHGQTAIRTVCAASLFVAHLGRPFAEPIAQMRDIYPRALEAGDLLWAGYAGALSLSMHLEVGTHLSVLRRLSGKLERELGARVSVEAQLIARGLDAFAQLLGDHDDSASLSGVPHRTPLDPEYIESAGGSRYSVYVTTANLALARLLLGFPGEALELTLSIYTDMERVLFASWIIPRVALTLVAAAAAVVESGAKLPAGTSAACEHATRLIERWARGSADNYDHYASLAQGLRALEQGRHSLAMRTLEHAREHAARSGCRWVEGLSAEFLLITARKAGLSGYVRGALSQAWDAYQAWGARAKLAQLQVIHSELHGTLPGHASFRGPAARSGTWTRARPSSTPLAQANSPLDYESVLRSVATITDELRLDEVIIQVLDAALTNAGGDHGLLVLEIDHSLELVAELELDAQPELLSPPLAVEEAGARVPASLLRFCRRTGEALIVDDAQADPRFRTDPFVIARDSRSLLAVPIRLDEQSLGVLVLENRLSRDSFSPERFEALQLILAQAARAIVHARTLDALRESELRWRSVVDQAPDLIALFDAEGEVEFVNRNTKPGAMSHTEVLARIARSSVAEAWVRALTGVLDRGQHHELELELPGTDAQASNPSWWVARFAPIDDPLASARRKAIVIATEVSARKRAELDRAGLSAQLRQQQRLESLGTLASGVAHEINNPIQGIMNYAELLDEGRDEPALVGEYAHEIRVEAERVAAIVSSLLTFSRKERPRPLEPVDLGGLIANTLTLVRSVMRNDQIRLEVEVSEDLPLVDCRPQQIRQVLLNLVTNARDALNSAYPKFNPRKRIELRAETRGPCVIISVQDFGPGIPAEVLEHIFEPFFTTKGRDQGTGLGLALALGIVQDHEGELRVDTKLGQGTRFELVLPRDATLRT